MKPSEKTPPMAPLPPLEKGVPVPQIRRLSLRDKYGIKQFEVGDSRVYASSFSADSVQQTIAYFRSSSRCRGWKFVTRTVEDGLFVKRTA